MDIKELATQEYISTDITLRNVCTKYNLARTQFTIYLKRKEVSTKKKPKFDHTVFRSIDTEEKAYWLGFIAADGCVSYDPSRAHYNLEIGLAVKDREHLEKAKKFFKHTKEITYRESTNSCRLTMCNKEMCEDLIKLGITPRKSLTLKFPESLDPPLIRHFIRGYFDGDGSISKSKKSITFKLSMLGTYEFLSSIRMHYDCGVPLKKDKRHTNNTYYMYYRVGPALELLESIYKDSNIFLTRKKELYEYIMFCRSEKKLSELRGSKNGGGCDVNTVLSI